MCDWLFGCTETRMEKFIRKDVETVPEPKVVSKKKRKRKSDER